MCIRDRYIMEKLPVTAQTNGFSSRMGTNAVMLPILKCWLICCLLYTSDACRRIERSPSRGLGDVYKRQVHNGEITSYGTNKRFLESYGYKCSNATDSEVLAYLWDLLIRRHKLPIEIASEVLAPPFWEKIDRMPAEKRRVIETLRITYGAAMINGPASLLVAAGSGLTGVAGKGTMVGLTDRIKLRPLVCARKDEYTFMASEESAIKAICKNPDFVWAPRAGKPTVALVNGDV